MPANAGLKMFYGEAETLQPLGERYIERDNIA